MRITAATRVAGVAGWPARQSLSPLIHNAWIAATGVDAVYVAFEVLPDGFVAWLEGLRAGGVCGLNVTMPFKARALAAADVASQTALRAGGANTLVFGGDGAIRADSTDGRGLLAAFAEQAPAWRPEVGPVAVLGAGGAAQAAVAALREAGAPQVRVLARDREKAAAALGQVGAARILAADDPLGLADVTALVNASPIGMAGAAGPEIAWSALPRSAVVMDMVTSPLDTPLLQAARTRGHAVVDGLAMLIGQARPSFAAFFGVEPPPASELDVRALCLQATAEARA